MLIQEMHIEATLLLKRIDNKAFGRILPEELDWFFNMCTLEYALSRVNVTSDPEKLGFEKTKKRLSDIQTLIENVVCPTYKIDDTSMFAYLPDDFLGIINYGSPVVKYSCNSLNSTTASINKYYAVVDFKIFSSTLFSTYKIKELKADNTVVNILINYQTGAIGSTSASFMPYNEILTRLRDIDGLEVYWEWYGDMYKPNSFIFVRTSLDNEITKVAITDDVTTVYFDYQQQTLIGLTSTKGTEFCKAARLVSSDIFDNIVDYSFGETRYDSVVSTIYKNKYVLAINPTFISTGVKLTYIRKPRHISISLGWNCDLPPHTHSEIVALTARKYAAYKGNENYQQIAIETQLKD